MLTGLATIISSQSVTRPDNDQWGSGLAMIIANELEVNRERCLCGESQEVLISTYLALVPSTPAYLDYAETFSKTTNNRLIVSLQPPAASAGDVVSLQPPVVSASDVRAWYAATYRNWQSQYSLAGMDTLERLRVDLSPSIIASSIDDVVGSGTAKSRRWSASNTPRLYLMQFYRRSVFQAHNISSAPQSWDQLVDVLTAINGTDVDGDAWGDWALCLNLAPPCQASFLLMAIAASVMQTRGTTQGFLFDIQTGQPLSDSAGMRYSLEVYRRLVEFASPASFGACNMSNTEFAAGKCAVTLGYDMAFAHIGSGLSSARRDFGADLLPGSTQVWDRTSDAIVLCGGPPSPGGASGPCVVGVPLLVATVGGGAAEVQGIVNQPVFSSFGLDRVWYDTTYSLPQQSAGAIMLVLGYRRWSTAFLARRQRAFNSVDALISRGGSALQDYAEEWKDAGFDVGDVAQYVSAAYRSYRPPTGNTAPDLAIPLSPAFRAVIEAAAADIAFAARGTPRFGPGSPPMLPDARDDAAAAIARALGARLAMVWDVAAEILLTETCTLECTQTALLAAYQSGLGFAEAPPPPAPPPEPAANPYTPMLRATGIAGIAIGSAVALLFIGVGVFLVRRSLRRPARNGPGSASGAPGLGPDTTVLVTDVQNSTALWEQEAAGMGCGWDLHYDDEGRAIIAHAVDLRALTKAKIDAVEVLAKDQFEFMESAANSGGAMPHAPASSSAGSGGGTTGFDGAAGAPSSCGSRAALLPRRPSAAGSGSSVVDSAAGAAPSTGSAGPLFYVAGAPTNAGVRAALLYNSAPPTSAPSEGTRVHGSVPLARNRTTLVYSSAGVLPPAGSAGAQAHDDVAGGGGGGGGGTMLHDSAGASQSSGSTRTPGHGIAVGSAASEGLGKVAEGSDERLSGDGPAQLSRQLPFPVVAVWAGVGAATLSEQLHE
ncbi:hypothetical protein FOA52_006644 [Chlamydomonas sp. UWO 241]|nr:hypothetical protein FOA52_006644 [Chlamydomonas sp. UWO 241]